MEEWRKAPSGHQGALDFHVPLLRASKAGNLDMGIRHEPDSKVYLGRRSLLDARASSSYGSSLLY